MSDQAHPAGVRLQSSAVVAAALITTLGAITAAFIQTGVFGKPPTANVSDFQPATAGSANFRFSPTQQPNTDRYPISRTVSNSYVPPAENYARPAPHIAKASFVGIIEPVNEQPQTNVSSEAQPDTGSRFTPAPPVERSSPASWATPTSGVNSSAAVNTAAFITPTPAAPAETRTEQIVGYAPALRPQEAPVKILPSPWSFLSATPDSDHATADTKLASKEKLEQPSKTAAKKSSWDSLARLWPWHG